MNKSSQLCLFLTPVSPAEPQDDHGVSRVIDNVIDPAVNGFNFRIETSRQVFQHLENMEEVVWAIFDAKLVLIDLSQEATPSLHYQIALAHARDSNVLYLKRGDPDGASYLDIGNIIFYNLTDKQVREAVTRLRNAIEHCENGNGVQRGPVAAVLRHPYTAERLASPRQNGKLGRNAGHYAMSWTGPYNPHEADGGPNGSAPSHAAPPPSVQVEPQFAPRRTLVEEWGQQLNARSRPRHRGYIR
ncbi:MAG: hypothetical protein GVY13_09165 [Alphaproteobacteria bacterium]|jgi:hypothetical protein|nr:hypothetical protein [Alphaproteobacteria bacterium]